MVVNVFLVNTRGTNHDPLSNIPRPPIPSVMFRCLNKKELDMAMEHGLENITWERAWEQP